MDQLLGAHTSTAGGIYKAIDRAEKLGFNAIQIFTKNNNRWNQRPFSLKEIELFREKLDRSGLRFILSHCSYLINLCATDKNILAKSRSAFLDEIIRCSLLGIKYLNFHPGSHMGAGEKTGIGLIAESINIALSSAESHNVNLMIETTAGQGTALGYRFEQIADIISKVENKQRISVCIDTAHLFAAGYDIREPLNYKKVIRSFDTTIGMNFLKCIHMNDSKKELGSRIDRHEHIGKGLIGLKGFSNIMNDKKLKGIPKILETPKGKDQKEDLINIKILKGLIKS